MVASIWAENRAKRVAPVRRMATTALTVKEANMVLRMLPRENRSLSQVMRLLFPMPRLLSAFRPYFRYWDGETPNFFLNT